MYIRSVAPIYFGSYRSPLFSMRSLNNVLNTAQVLRLADCLRHYQISSLQVAVCAKRVIPFNTIVELAIGFLPALVNSLPFSSYSTKRLMGLHRVIYPF